MTLLRRFTDPRFVICSTTTGSLVDDYPGQHAAIKETDINRKRQNIITSNCVTAPYCSSPFKLMYLLR